MTQYIASLERKDNRENRKRKGEEVGKGEWEAEDLHRPNKALLNHLKPLMNWLSTQNSNLQRSTCQGSSTEFTKGWAFTEEELDGLQIVPVAIDWIETYLLRNYVKALAEGANQFRLALKTDYIVSIAIRKYRYSSSGRSHTQN